MQLFSSVCFSSTSEEIPEELMRKAKQMGFSDRQIGKCLGLTEVQCRQLRMRKNVVPWVKKVPWEMSLVGEGASEEGSRNSWGKQRENRGCIVIRGSCGTDFVSEQILPI